MPISKEFLEKFYERHGLSRVGELHCWAKTVAMEGNLVVVCLNMEAPEAARCGFGRELASRLAHEKGSYITDKIGGGHFNHGSKPVFAIDCKEESELEPALDKLRSLKIEYIRMVDRIYDAFKPKSL